MIRNFLSCNSFNLTLPGSNPPALVISPLCQQNVSRICKEFWIRWSDQHERSCLNEKALLSPTSPLPTSKQIFSSISAEGDHSKVHVYVQASLNQQDSPYRKVTSWYCTQLTKDLWLHISPGDWAKCTSMLRLFGKIVWPPLSVP